MRKLISGVAALALAVAQGAAAEAPPAANELPAILGCADEAGYFALGETLFTDDFPSWLTRTERKDRPFSYFGYELAKPVDFYGRQVREIGFVQQWIVTPLSRADALALASELGLERAPMRAEQHFKFLDGDAGPLFSAFELGSGLSMLLPEEGPKEDILYVGCNYQATSRDEFLAQAAQADEQLRRMRGEVLDLLTKPADEAE